MRRLVLISAAVAATLTLAGVIFSDASAQAPARGGSPTANIALVDVQFIFKNHARFKQQMEEMRKDVEAAEAKVQQATEGIRAKAEQLERYKGTPDYKRLEEEITKEQTELAITVRQQKRDFLKREAKIYHNTYREVLQAVGYIAQHNGIGLVMKFNREQADGENPEEVLRDINKPLVWHSNGLDITDMVLRDLNRGSGPPAGASGAGVGGRGGPSVPFQR